MIRSEQINELAKALGEFQKAMPSFAPDAENPFFHSSYTTLAGLVKGAGALLPEHGLSVAQITENSGAVTTLLMHTSGQYIGGTLELNPVKDDPQGRGSAITYARRYSYASILGLITDKDDDGNSASNPGKSKVTKKPAGNPKKSPAKNNDQVDQFVNGKSGKNDNGELDSKQLKDAKEALILDVVAKSNRLKLNYNRPMAIALITSAIKAADLPARLTTQKQFNVVRDLTAISLEELCVQRKDSDGQPK